ncbi:MAG: hypothetical protein ACLTGN_11230 [Clostridium sp.]
MRLKNRDFETFNDGVLTVCEASGRTLVKTVREGIRFGSRTVGVKRFWEVKVAGSEIACLVSVPNQPGIKRDDIVLLKGRQYRISQIQEKFDTRPPCLYLSLESIQTPFRDERRA